LAHTPAGRYLYAIGGNPDAARLSGVRVDFWSAVGLLFSGGVGGLAGVLFVSQAGPSLSFGPPLLLPAFAATFLGSTQLRPGKFNVWGTLLAIYVLATGVQGLELISGKVWLSQMFNGVALVVAVAIAGSSARRASLKRRDGSSTETIPSDRRAFRRKGQTVAVEVEEDPITVSSA
jgi:ribose transport system permease protein